MKIEIWSDIACPYCYIGKRKLEKALEQFPHKDNVELVWHSYELNPDLPKKTLNSGIYQYYAESFDMTIEKAHQTLAKTAELAKEVDLDYDFDNQIVANTSDALRLIKLAKEYGLATEAEEALFEAYFIKGKDISDRNTLILIGVQLGIKEEVINTILGSDKYLVEIKQDIEYSESTLNLEYIPFYLFNNKEIVQGSIPSEEYLSVLTKAYADWERNGVSEEKGDIISGQSCSIDGVCS